MSDLINRQDALCFNASQSIKIDNTLYVPYIDWYSHLSNLPSAEPERKKGKWVDKSGGIEGAWNYCSVCGEQAIDLYDFCPNCGSYNGGERDE